MTFYKVRIKSKSLEPHKKPALTILNVHLNFHTFCNLCCSTVSKFNNLDINMHIYTYISVTIQSL